jgi:predicted ATPase/DNA-binding CsgD family transcriptional regulator
LDEPVTGAPNNLPAQLTAFIGRARELDELRELLASSRLLTLNGTGGCGKTRLALQLAGEILDDYAGGTWLVELAQVVDPDRVAAALAQALGERDLTGDLVEVVVDRLTERTLVILDNCEHLLAPVARLVDTLLRRCPQLTVIATSREPLGVPGEVAWRVPSMAVAEVDGRTPTARAERSDAVRLFVERAERARPNFRMTDENATAVVQICQRLDGIPLAIELAAARIRGMSVDQVAGALDDRFRVLTGGARTVLPRQQTLQASVDWGYDLLTETERAVFRRLSVFAGGFTLDAAESVVVDDRVDALEVLDVLLALVDKSFVVAAHDSNRYSMLETLRQYGAARLFDAGETESLRDRHLAWATARFDAVRLRATGHLVVMPEIDVEIENLRSAFEWAALTSNGDAACILASSLMWWEGDLGDAAESVRIGARAIEIPGAQVRLRLLLHAILVWAYFELGDIDASAEMCDVVLSRVSELDEDDFVVRVTCLRMTSFSVRHALFGDNMLEECLAIGERTRDPAVVALCTSMLAMNAAWSGDLAAALAFADRTGSDPDTVAGRNQLSARATVAMAAGHFEEARIRCDELAAIYLNGLPRLVVHVEAQRVFLDIAQGVDTGAAERIAGVLDDARRRRFLSGVASAGWAPGAWALAQGNVDTALHELSAWRDEGTRTVSLGRHWFGVWIQALLAAGRVDEARAEVELSRGTTRVEFAYRQPAVRLTGLEGLVARARGDTSAAESSAHDALAQQHEHGWRPEVAHSIEALAGIASANESYAEAARLAASAQRMRNEMGYVLRWPYEQQLLDADLAAARTALGEDAFGAAWAEGLALDEAAAVAYTRRARGERKRPSAGWESLTPVEADVVRLVAEGLTNKQVGDALFVGAETVKTHLSHVYDKLGVRSRTALAARFAERQDSSAART